MFQKYYLLQALYMYYYWSNISTAAKIRNPKWQRSQTEVSFGKKRKLFRWWHSVSTRLSQMNITNLIPTNSLLLSDHIYTQHIRNQFRVSLDVFLLHRLNLSVSRTTYKKPSNVVIAGNEVDRLRAVLLKLSESSRLLLHLVCSQWWATGYHQVF